MDSKLTNVDKVETEHVEQDVAKAAAAEFVADTPEEKRLVRKIDRRLLPMLWVMYIFNYLDRTNVGNARIGGMAADLSLSSSQYSLVLSIFFIGYVLAEVPSNMILSRTRPSIFLPAIMIIWGAMSIGVKGVDNLAGMVAFRFFLGIVEAGFFPGVMLLMSCWYKPAELSKRIAMFYTAALIAGAFGGLLAGGIIEGMEGLGGVRGWKWLFIIEGLSTVAIAIGAFFILPDYPTTTKFLTPEEKDLAILRLQTREELEDEMTHKQALMASLRDPRTWLFLVIYNVLNCVGTISYFFPTLMGSLGYTGRTAQFMTVPVYVVALVITVAAGWNADRTQQKAWHVLGACIGGIVAFIICVSVENSAARYTFICFGGAGIWTAIPIFLSWMVTMFDGREKRAISIALINGVGNLSSVYGSFFWPVGDAPKYTMGFAITTAFMGLAGILTVGAKWKYGDKGVRGAMAAH